MADSVLRTVLIEVEGILNSKPLGYLSTDVSDLDPITPNLLLMGRRDASLPQAMFADTDILQGEVGPRVRPVVRLIPLPELKDPHED